MPFNKQLLLEALEQFNQEAVELNCNDFISEIYLDPEKHAMETLQEIMQALREKRMFKSMVSLGECCIQSEKNNLRIRKLFAQACIEEGHFTAALCLLNKLKNDTDGAEGELEIFENSEAYALIGRVYKQLYINTCTTKEILARNFLTKSVEAYQKIYDKNARKYLYHGINTLALAARASKDGIQLTKPVNTEETATSILAEINLLQELDEIKKWDFAIAAEAYLALGKYGEALRWTEKYISAQGVDAFQIASTLRQFTEIWKLDKGPADAQQILTVLRSALLDRNDGIVVLSPGEARREVHKKNADPFKKELVLSSPDSYKAYKWYMKGAGCCPLVARIGVDTTEGVGTGFLLNGEMLNPQWKDRLVLLTNEHVVTEKSEHSTALVLKETRIIFEVLELNTGFIPKKILYSSPYGELDVTILQFEEKDELTLKQAIKEKNIELLEIAPTPPNKKTSRVYIIGHPKGQTLQLSLQDNALLDYDEKVLHYRAATVGGSSGSPVFNSNWEVIGIHHGGNPMTRRLTGEGWYAANEGICIQIIINETQKIN